MKLHQRQNRRSYLETAPTTPCVVAAGDPGERQHCEGEGGRISEEEWQTILRNACPGAGAAM